MRDLTSDPADDRFAEAIARLRSAHATPGAPVSGNIVAAPRAEGPGPDLDDATGVQLPSRRARHQRVAEAAFPDPQTVADDDAATWLGPHPEDAQAARSRATTPSAALEVARLYSAAAGHASDEAALSESAAPASKSRFSLARATALVAICALLTVGGGVVAGGLWPSRAAGPELPETGIAQASPDGAGAGVATEGGQLGGADVPAVAGEATAVPPVAPLPDVFVHVVGQVANPGVVTLPTGARVADAIAAAGGATVTADLAAINLARVVTDGEQLRVPAPGEEVTLVAPMEAPAPLATEPAMAMAPDPADGKINLNTADAAALQTLPGIGPALSERIIQWRELNGSFASVDEITKVSGIGPAVLANVRDKVVV